MKTNVEVAQANESKIRIVAFFVLVLTLIYLYSNIFAIPLFLMIDFLLRSFQFGRFSIIGWISELTVKFLKLPFKPVYYPPKRFAARIGLAFSFLIEVFHVIEWNTSLLAFVLMFFAFLESFFSFCAGCYVYSFFIRK